MKNNLKKRNDIEKISNVKQAIITAVSIALCVVLPIAFHSIPQAGMIYCPMHIAVFLCGLVCAPQYAFVCGLLGPAFSCMIMAMPNAASLLPMMIELAVYGVVTSLIMKFIHTGKMYVDVYISLTVAMLVGRIVAGLLKALIFARGEFTIIAWATTYFVTALPGIAIQLVLVPTVYVALEKANLIPSRYICIDGEEIG